MNRGLMVREDMNSIILEHTDLDGVKLSATFMPERGMNLISFKKGDIELIDQSTFSLFDERSAGLGALIGPHFHRKRVESVPKIADESLFPHIARVRAKGVQDPFSHGIARYAPWKAEASIHEVKAVLTGKDLWNGIPLSTLEGQNFKMEFHAKLKANGLFLDLSIVSDTDSLVGIHYYYRLPNGKGRVTSHIRNRENIEPEWNFDADHQVQIDLDHQIDATFRPYPHPREGFITLETSEYTLKTHYSSVSEENCWQLYHPKEASFVCIEPISSQDPRHPNLTVSGLKIHLEPILNQDFTRRKR